MPLSFRIAKLLDKELVTACGLIRAKLAPVLSATLKAILPGGAEIDLSQEDIPENAPKIQYIFAANTQALNSLRIDVSQVVFEVERQRENITDRCILHENWVNSLPPDKRGQFHQLYVSVLALVREQFRIADTEASLVGGTDNDWTRYKYAQMEVLSSLQHSLEGMTVKSIEAIAAADNRRKQQFSEMEAELHAQIQEERNKLQSEFEKRKADLSGRENELSQREAAFNTKESRYVLRQKQEEQIKQIKAWLEGWTLTKGTSAKRLPILITCIAALAIFGALLFVSTYQTYDLLVKAVDLSKLPWWEWAWISLKSFIPLAIFTSILIFLIKWSSSWARQHADEEFRNRSLLIDIGRSSWLLEAVRDAGESSHVLPPELLKELSRNLFAFTPSPDSEIHPETVADVLLQGLTSVRFKSAGTEVEATREKRK